MEVYVIRHTKVAIHAGTCYGQSDVALASTFESEVEAIRPKLPKKFDHIFSSPFTRCVELANKFFAPQMTLVPDLKEVNFGNWELKTWSEIPAEESQPWINDFVNESPPAGESLQNLYKRVSLFLDQLRSQEFQRVLIVTHAGPIRCIWAYVLQIPLENIFKIPVSYGESFSIDLTENFVSIKTFPK